MYLIPRFLLLQFFELLRDRLPVFVEIPKAGIVLLMLLMEFHEASDVGGDVWVHVVIVQLLVAGLELLNLFFRRLQVALQLLEILLILLLQLPVGLLLGLDFRIRYRGGTCLLAVRARIQYRAAVLPDILLLLEVVIVVADVVIED